MDKHEAVELFSLPKQMLPYLPDTLPDGITDIWEADKGFYWEVWYEQDGEMRKMWLMKEPIEN